MVCFQVIVVSKSSGRLLRLMNTLKVDLSLANNNPPKNYHDWLEYPPVESRYFLLNMRFANVMLVSGCNA